MKRLLIALSVMAAFGGSVQARPEATRFAGPALKLSWRPYQKLPNIPGNIEEVSMTLDSAGVAHFAVLSINGGLGEQAYELRYFNTRYESRSSAAGFSVPYLIDRARVNNQESLQGIDIKSGPNGDTHLVWIHGYVNGDRVAHVRFSSGGDQGSLHWLTSDPVAGEYHATPQVQSTPDGVVHVLVTHASVNFPPYTRLEHLVATTGLAWVSRIDQSVPAGRARWSYWKAGANTYQFYATWNESTTNGPFQNGTDVFFSSGIYTPGQTSVDWNSYGKSELTFSGIDWEPDLAVDKDGGLHFAWGKRPVGLLPRPNPSVWYAYNGAARQVSIERVGDPPFLIDSGIRVRTSTNSYVHVFYGGFAHAWAQIGSGDWAQEEPLPAPNDQKLRQDHQADNSKPIPSSPLSVAEFQGRFDLVDRNFYVRTYETMPDGASYVPAFPGAQVNIVPLSGRFQYRLNLFSTKGVGPCQSLGLTYNTKESIAGLTGQGWTMDHLMHLTVGGDDDNITLTLPSGLDINLSFSGGYTIADSGFGFVAAIQKLGSTWKATVDGGTEYVFNSFGKLGTVQEPTGNKLEVHYYDSGPNAGMPSEIVDMLGNGGPGRTTRLIYGTGVDARNVVEVIDPASNHYQLNYSFTTIGRQLTSVVFLGVPEHPTYSFTYGINSLMDQVTMPRGNVYKIFYDSAGRVEHTQDPLEKVFVEGQGDFSPVNSSFAVQQYVYNDPSDALLIGAGKFHTRVIDRRGYSTIHVFDAANKFGVTEIWDATAMRDAETMPPPGVPPILPLVRTFDSFGNVLTQTDRWGSKTTYTYAQAPAAPWLTNLLATVKKPNPSGPGDQLVEEFTYTNDRFGNVLSHTTYVGGVARTTSNAYDDAGRLTNTLFPNVTRPDGVVQDGVTVTNIYGGPRLQFSQAVNEEGHVTDYSVGGYDPVNGLPLAVLREGGTQPELTEYDIMGNVVRTKKPQGGGGNDAPGFTEYGLDGLYRVVTVQDPAGRVTTNGYDEESHVVSVQPPAGGATTSVYDKRGILSSVTSPDGTWSQFVDGNGNVRRRSNIRGFFANTDYDPIGRVSATRIPGFSANVGAGGGGPVMETQWTYDGFDQATSERYVLETRVGSPANRITKSVFDHRRRPVRLVAADQMTVTKSFYDDQDQVLATESWFDNVFQTATLTFRDARDRLERVRVQDAPFGQNPAHASDTVSILNRAGTPVQSVDPLGNPQSPGYEHKTTSILDARERVQVVIDGLGEIVRENVWGDDDLLVESKVPDPATKSRTLVTAETRAYTARKELKTFRNRNNVGITYTYNSIQGQIDTVTDALGRVTRTTYYADTQRIDEVIVALGTLNERRTKSIWASGLLDRTIVWSPDPSSGGYNSTYRYFYDEADRLERFEAPMVSAEVHKFTAFGEEFQFIAGSKSITHGYNSLGQLTSNVWTGAQSQTETRTYNGIGLLETIISGPDADHPSFSKTMFYDTWHGTLAAELFSVAGSLWKSQSHFFDEAKNYRDLTDAEGGGHHWTYDANNRITQIRYGPQAVCEVFYTVGGHLDHTVLRDASGGAIAVTSHVYDGLGRKARQTTTQVATGQTLADFEWEHDDLDLVTAVKVNHLGVRADLIHNERRELVSESWTGNNGGQSPPPDGTVIQGLSYSQESGPSNEPQASKGATTAVAAATKAYTFDPAGNRATMTVGSVQTTYRYNSASQLVLESSTAQSVSHLYDEWGNESSRTTTPSGSATTQETYLYNYLNLLSDYSKDSPAAHEQYDFWPTGERYAKTNQINLSELEIYVARGGDVVTEYSDAATLKNRYVQGTGVDQKCSRISAAGARRHYLGDSVGTLSVTLTDTGSAAEVSLKDVWGNPLTVGTSERYGFAQREHDFESGLVYMRARMYDPRTGRFTQTDPVWGNRPGEHFLYAGNDPVSMTDPLGLYKFGEKWSDYVNPAAYGRWARDKVLDRVDRLAYETRSPLVAGLVGFGTGLEKSTTDLMATPADLVFKPFNDVKSVTQIYKAQIEIGASPLVAGARAIAITEFESIPTASSGMNLWRDTDTRMLARTNVAVQRTTMEKVGDAIELVTDAAILALPLAAKGDAWISRMQSAHQGIPIVTDTGSPFLEPQPFKPTDYTRIKDPPNVNASTKPTPRQVREMKAANRTQHGGRLVDDVTGEAGVDSAKSMSGVTPPSNEIQVDHVIPVDKGGTRTQSNLQLRTRENNREKSNKLPGE